MRNVVVILALLALVTACGASHNPARAAAAIRAVMRSEPGAPFTGMFPTMPTSVHCRIAEGGPSGGVIVGRCKSAADLADAGRAAVRLTQTWTVGYPAQGRRSHTWEFRVTPSRVRFVGDHGDFPLQYMK